MIEKLLNKLGYYKRIVDPPVFNVVNYDVKTVYAVREYPRVTIMSGTPESIIKRDVANVLAEKLVDICEYVTEEDPERNVYRVYAKLHYVERRD